MKSVLDRHGVEVDANLLICYPEEENVSYDLEGDPEEENVTGDPEEDNVTGGLEEMLSKTEVEKLMADVDHYEDKLDKRTCLDMYQTIGPMAKEAEQELKLQPEGVHGQVGKRKFEAAPGVLDATDGWRQKTNF
ncbi:hypothetical protein VPH35_105694 [Triticum aestivum]